MIKGMRTGDDWLECSDGETRWGLFGAAGVMFRHAPPGQEARYLVELRSGNVHDGGLWGVPGGALDEDEDPLEGALREALEEMQCELPAHREVNDVSWQPCDEWHYTTYLVDVSETFTPLVDDEGWESDDWRWCTRAQLMQMDLHPGLAQIIDQLLDVDAPTHSKDNAAPLPQAGSRVL